MPQQAKTFRWLLPFITLIMMVGCQTFYKVIPGRTGMFTATTIDSLQPTGRSFFLRNGTQSFLMKNISVNSDSKTLRCDLDTLTQEHKLYVTRGADGKKRYKKSSPEQSGVLNEVHIYTTQKSPATIGEGYTLSLDQVQKIEIIQADKKRTRRSHAFGTVGYTFGIGFIILIIIAAASFSSWK